MISDDWLHIFVLLQLEYKDFDLNYDIDLNEVKPLYEAKQENLIV